MSRLEGEAGGALDAAVVAQAADWFVVMQSGGGEREHAQCMAWRRQHPAHELAWQRISLMSEDLQATSASVPKGAATQVVEHVRTHEGRRRVLKGLAGMGGMGLLLALAGRQLLWTADYRSGVGERRQWALQDGTLLQLNTDSAVDVVYGAGARELFLRRGEIMITTAKDALLRPMVVHTPHGQIRPVGTRFDVRLFPGEAGYSRVMVLEGAVQVTTLNGEEEAMMQAGQTLDFNGRTMASALLPGDPASVAWVEGMLIARDMRLDDFMAELSRYRSGWLKCDPDVAHLRVTGTFLLDDTDQVLVLLARILPIRTRRLSRYWVTVQARA